eukprot:3273218-Pleurochrysis_carterae.AAC.1
MLGDRPPMREWRYANSPKTVVKLKRKETVDSVRDGSLGRATRCYQLNPGLKPTRRAVRRPR